MSTYIIADNQDITHEGLTALLSRLGKSGQIVEAGSCCALQEKLNLYPESIVILDYALFDFASIHQFINMKAGASQSAWLLFSDEFGEVFLRQALLLDPTISAVTKQESLAQITEALQAVSTGERYLCETAVSILDNDVPKPANPQNLTATEKIILREIASGKMTKEIAWEKNLSFHTVNTHRKNIFRKLEVTNVHEATKYAIRAGLIDLSEFMI